MDRKGRIIRNFARGIALILFAIFLSAKIPSSKCHCHDPEKSKKVVCPFGVLRTLTFVEIVSPTSLAILLMTYPGLAVYSLIQLHGVVVAVDLRNRDPPISYTSPQ